MLGLIRIREALPARLERVHKGDWLRCAPGGFTALPRRISEVGLEIPFICRAPARFLAPGRLGCDFPVQCRLTQCCWPVSGPDWPRRGRLRRLAPAALQAFCCSCVSDAL